MQCLVLNSRAQSCMFWVHWNKGTLVVMTLQSCRDPSIHTKDTSMAQDGSHFVFFIFWLSFCTDNMVIQARDEGGMQACIRVNYRLRHRHRNRHNQTQTYASGSEKTGGKEERQINSSFCGSLLLFFVCLFVVL